MKYFINKYSSFLLLAFLAVFTVISCRHDDDNAVTIGAPFINSISPSVDVDGNRVDLVPVTTGNAGNTYVIQGSGFGTLQHIYFNDVETLFNPTLVTDKTIIVTINQDTPYANVNNKVKLVTQYGTTEYDFVIAPPAPVCNSFNPINAADGETITIYGNYFLNPVVKAGTTEAKVISSTLNEIKVVLPAGSKDKLITITTMSGSVTATQAIGSALYDDAIQNDAGHWTWSGVPIVTDYKDDKFQGLQSMQIKLGGWDGADFKFNPIDVSKYKAFRVRLKSTVDNPDASLNLVFGSWTYQIKQKFGTTWTYIEIPFSDIGNPTTFDQLTIQESGGFGGNTVLIDDMGFVLK